MALSDADVEKQIHQMKSFIEREAREKVEEILAKAEEEFNIEKARLVQQEKLKIMAYYERKEKQVELQRKIQRSNLLNQSRLAILKARDEHLQKILDETRTRLSEEAANKERYKEVVQALITQGLCQLLEPEAIVVCKKDDVEIVESVLGAAVKEYKRVAQMHCKLTVSSEQYLSPDCAGGVELQIPRGTIRVSNTLESRLLLLSGQMLPEIRELLFGANPSRKFSD